MNEFKSLFSHVEKMRNRYLNILSAHKIFDTISILSAPNIVGKEKAGENMKLFNDYKYFFITTKESCSFYVLIEIAKFFDNSLSSLTLNKIINFTESNLKKLSKNDFQIYHKNRGILPELFDKYQEFSRLDLENLKNNIKSKDKIINKLKKYRDQYLAHDDIKKIKVKISIGEVKQLMEIIEDFIELFYLRLDFSSNSYKDYVEEPEREIKSLIKILKENEKARLQKISKLYLQN